MTGGDNKRMANVVAYTDCELLIMDIYDFRWIFGHNGREKLGRRNTKMIEMLESISNIRTQGEAEILEKNQFISKLNTQQKNDIIANLKTTSLIKGDVLWSQGITCEYSISSLYM